MDIPLVLRETKNGRLVYSIPLWYRLLMVAIGAVLVGAIVVSGGKPTAFEWVALAVVAGATLYEERWILDAEKKSLHHRYGLLFLAKSIYLPFERLENFRLSAFVRGSTPGSAAEKEESARILAAVDPMNDLGALRDRKARTRKAYVSLLADDKEGGGLVINTLPARRASELKLIGSRLASAAEKRFETH